MIKISVVVPIYNAEKYLVECLDSIMKQTLEKIEIILIDDGSTDGSAEICRRYLSDPRVTYYYKENEGLAAARQDGIEMSHGEYVGFVDSDDWIEPDMYEKMYAAAKSNDSDIVFCNCIENEDGHRFTPEMRSGAYNRQQILDEILPRTLAYISESGGKRAIRWSNCLRIYKMSLLRDNHIAFDRRFRRSQDLQLTYEATLAAENYYYLGDEYLYHNRVVGNSLSRGYTKNLLHLYEIWLDRLYKDTELFTELDLMPQMHLRAFFSIADCIDNELKPLCPNDKETKIRIIKEIMEHPVCERFKGNIPVEKLEPLLRGYYELICKKDAKGIFTFTEKYERRQKIEKKYIKPAVHFIAEGPVTGKLYKKLRHRG